MKTVTPQTYLDDTAYRDHVLLDVRSPGEYGTGKLPGAKSLPLFTDEQRAEVGTLYKQKNPDVALLRGLEIAGGKMRWLVEEARRLAPGNKVVVHCWRGGQRSGSVAWLLERAGFDVTQLTGGYKATRAAIRAYFRQPEHDFRVLSGPTGSGKTDVLLAMRQRGAHVVDLEGLAHHKGSAFGALGEAPQPTSEEFENLLYAALRAIPAGSTVWLEDESRMIGHVYLTDEFYATLTAAPVVVLEQPVAWRVERLVRQYAGYPKSGLVESFRKIQKRLGGQHLKAALAALEADDFATAAEIALVYYDKAYRHYGERKGAAVLATVTAADRAAGVVADQVLGV